MVEIYNSLEQSNYWHNEPIKAGLIREDYLQSLILHSDNTLIKVLVGQRRVGKSYLLRQLIYHLLYTKNVPPLNIIYFNKESLGLDSIKTAQDLQALITYHEEKHKLKGKIYLLLDEIQEVFEWEKLANSYAQDPKKDYELYLTGSNSHMLSGELATYLSGRYVQFEIQPFSYSEYLKITEKTPNRQSFVEYLQNGSLPELFSLADPEAQRHYVEALYDTIILKDIVSRYKIKDIYLLEHIFKYLADNIGHLFSINKVVDYLKSQRIKTNFETVSNYITYLSRTFLVHEADRYDIKGKVILANPQKYYLNDLSFKNYYSSSFDSGLGCHLENAVYLHYKRAGYKLYVGKIGEQEVDFIAEKGNNKKYIQVTFTLDSETVINREFGALEKISDAYEKLVISLDDYSLGNRNGIRHLQAWELEL